MRAVRHRCCERGSSLLEVMLSVLIVSVGLIGALKLQSESLRQGADSRYVVVASAYASDALDRLSDGRATPSAWAMAASDTPDSLSGDAATWLGAVQRDLPGGKAELNCDSSQCSLILYWTPAGRDTMSASYVVRL